MASQTARTLITRSLRDLGVLAVGETATGSEADDALLKLNELLEAWSLERLLVYSIVEVTKLLTSGVATYTLGVGGAINTGRPQRIENATLRDAQGLDLPLRVLTRDEYAGIYLKATQSTWPGYVYNDNAYPLATLTFWPVPSASDKTVHLWLWQPLTSIAALDTSVNFPPGYSRALRVHLAAELASEYGRELTQALVAVGITAKDVIKSQAAEGVVQEMRFDGRLDGTRYGRWNYRTGEYA